MKPILAIAIVLFAALAMCAIVTLSIVSYWEFPPFIHMLSGAAFAVCVILIAFTVSCVDCTEDLGEVVK